MVSRRIPISIGFFVLGAVVVIIGSTANITDIGFTGRLSLGDDQQIQVSPLVFYGIAISGVGITIFAFLKEKNNRK